MPCCVCSTVIKLAACSGTLHQQAIDDTTEYIMTDTIVYSQQGSIGTLLLNNPQKHNALGMEQLQGIHRALEQAAASNDLRVLVLTGTGDKTFCAGASLGELSGGDIGDEAFQKMASAVAAFPVPTICALNGNVFGGGAELALSCDFRIGITGSRMRVPAAAIGLCYPLSGIQKFVARLGPHVAKRVLVASEEFDANELLHLGFYDHLVEPLSLAEKTRELANHIAGLAPLAVKAMKSLIDEAAEIAVDTQRAEQLSKQCLESHDLQEGFAAKAEKRSPVFTGG